jgi:hypothetical protein
MKESYWLIGGVVLFHFGRLLYLYYQKHQYDKADEEIADIRFDSYLKLREETLALKPEDLNIDVPAGEEAAFAVILEIHTVSTIQAIAAFANGHVWAFNSQNARKYTRDDNGDKLKARATEAIRVGQYHFARMRRKNAEKLLPGYVKFHILTNLDVYSVDGPIDDMLPEYSQWEELAASMLAVDKAMHEVLNNNPIKRVYPKFKIKRTRPANL